MDYKYGIWISSKYLTRMGVEGLLDYVFMKMAQNFGDYLDDGVGLALHPLCVIIICMIVTLVGYGIVFKRFGFEGGDYKYYYVCQFLEVYLAGAFMPETGTDQTVAMHWICLFSGRIGFLMGLIQGKRKNE